MAPQGICATSERTVRQFILDFNTTSCVKKLEMAELDEKT